MKKAILLGLSILLLNAAALSQGNVEVFDKYVEAARNEWKVPGISVVVVQDGKVLLSKGYGVRELGKNEPVTSETLFGAMSTTKAMTTMALEMLVDEGKLKFILNKDVTGELSHWQFDTFMSKWSNRWYPEGLISFTVSPYSGNVESVNADGAVLRKEAKPAP
jgi:hypothetical protein